MATISMTTEEYHALLGKSQELEQEIVKLKADLTTAKLNSGDPKQTQSLTMLARALLQCTRFAVAQMPPEASKGWPYEDLVMAAGLLMALPDAGPDEVSLSIEFRTFAGECEQLEIRRNPQYGPRPDRRTPRRSDVESSKEFLEGMSRED